MSASSDGLPVSASVGCHRKDQAAVDLISEMKADFIKSLAAEAGRVMTFKGKLGVTDVVINWAPKGDKGMANSGRTIPRRSISAGGSNMTHDELMTPKPRNEDGRRMKHAPSWELPPPPQRPGLG